MLFVRVECPDEVTSVLPGNCLEPLGQHPSVSPPQCEFLLRAHLVSYLATQRPIRVEPVLTKVQPEVVRMIEFSQALLVRPPLALGSVGEQQRSERADERTHEPGATGDRRHDHCIGRHATMIPLLVLDSKSPTPANRGFERLPDTDARMQS